MRFYIKCLKRLSCYSVSIIIIIKIFLVLDFKSSKIDLSNHRIKIKQNSLNTSSCYSPFDSNNKQNNKNLLEKHPNCTHENNWIQILNDGTLVYNSKYLDSNSIIIKSCEYSTVKWYLNDFTYDLTKSIQIKNGEKLNTDEQFFNIECTTNGSVEYKTSIAKIFKPKLPIKSHKNPINILMLGFDSVSKTNWFENLPKSSDYLQNILKSTVLNGYNIVGDGTPAALIPILTGKHEHELPNTIKKTDNNHYVDEVYPFVWRNFSEQLGYATYFGEDWPKVGTFEYRMIGFKEQPTTHYIRPFLLMLEKQKMINHYTCCIGSKTVLQLNIDYVKDFMQVYKKNGFFCLLHLNEYSHGSIHKLSFMDEQLFDFLQQFHLDPILSKNTILILYSDHGPRFTEQRKSIKGLLDERNPIFSIYLPELFEQRYKAEFDNLKENAHRLTTPFDIYSTFSHLISLETKTVNVVEKNNRSVSLFDKISPDRNCQQAGIDQHWCRCLKRSELVIDEVLTKMALLFVDYLNQVILVGYSDQCHELELKSINKVYLYDSSINSLNNKSDSIKKQAKNLNLNLLEAPAVEKDYKEYLFQVVVKPNDAQYEFTIIVENSLNNLSRINSVKINENQISRINKYGNDSFCVFNTAPSLRPYCYCRNSD